MTVIIHRAKNQFTNIPNEIINDQSLSFAAKGLIAIILSLPESYPINVQNLSTFTKDNEEEIIKCIKELELYGYVSYQQGK